MKDKKALLLCGESVDVKASCDVKKASALGLSDFSSYDIIISASPLYLNPDDEFMNAAAITDKVYKRLSWSRLIYCIVREAANFYYSRLKVSDNQVLAKSQMVYLIREARHVGMALGLDSIRYYAIDIDIRNLSDYLILKSQGLYWLSRELSWLYSVFEPSIIRNMPAQNFLIVSKNGALGLGGFKPIPWHKEERENILKACDVKVEYGEPIETGAYRGSYKTVGDQEHSEIIRLYHEEGLGMQPIAEKLQRSTASIKKHIDEHDQAIMRSSFCPACRRVHSSLETTTVKRM